MEGKNGETLLVAIVILNYNGKTYLERFLPSVLSHSPEDSVFVIENGSNDGSFELLKRNFPQVGTIKLNENHGFRGGYNKGLKSIKAKYYVLLNSDVEVTENWLNPQIELLEKNSSVAASMPKIKSLQDRGNFDYAGASGGFIDWLGYPFCRGRVFEYIEKDEGQYDDPREIFWASGACLLVRSNVFWEAGGLDEDFFAHMEEIDLCWRIQRLGSKIMVIPQSEVYHVGGGTLKSTNPRKTFLNFRNSLFNLVKNVPKGEMTKLLSLRILLDMVACIRFFISGKFGHALAVFQADWHALRFLSKIMKKRKGRFPKKLPGIYFRSVIVEYYLLGKKKFKDLKF